MKAVHPVKLELLSCSIQESDETDGTVWNAESTYAIGAKVRKGHVSYESVIADNKDKDPEAHHSGVDVAWRKSGATMPYRMLDDFMGTQTVVPTDEELKFTVPYRRCNAFAFLNVNAQTIHVRIVDDLQVVLYDKEFTLVQDISRLSAREYIFYPVNAVHEVIVTSTDMPIIGEMEVSATGGGVAIGHVVAGRSFYLGATQYGASYAENDYSKKTVDEFGIANFVKRSFAANVDATLKLNPSETPGIANVLRELRAIPALWVGDNRDDGLTTLTVWGWKDAGRITYDGPNEATINLTINGLI